jgi:ketosteroid isomerase-like protein
MRNVTFALVLLVGGVASAQGKGKGAGGEAAAEAAAKATIDKADAAFNTGDAKALIALVDKSYFGEGPTVSAKLDYDQFADHITKMLAKGGHLTRDGLTVKADEDGGAAWYIADYTFVPKVPRGALPVRRKMRESGALVKKGRDWKFVMTHMSMVQPDEDAGPTPPTTAAPMKK